MNKHRRTGRRILNNAQRFGAANSDKNSGKHMLSRAFSHEAGIRKTYLILFCVVMAGCIMALTTSNLPKESQKIAVPVCIHKCGDSCLIAPEPVFLSGIFTRNDTKGFSQVSIREYINESTQTFTSSIVNERPAKSSAPSIEYNDENTSVEDLDIADNNIDMYRPNSIATINDPVTPLSMFTERMQRSESEHINESYTLTIVIIGEDGMAVGLQNGEMLLLNPMMPSEDAYEVTELLGGERFILTAGPDDDEHYVQWTAFLTNDSEQSLPLNMQINEPPVSTCIFIMPEADVTIVIEFTNERPDYFDLDITYQQPVLDGMIPDSNNIPDYMDNE